jgi:hypothetical protein
VVRRWWKAPRRFCGRTEQQNKRFYLPDSTPGLIPLLPGHSNPSDCQAWVFWYEKAFQRRYSCYFSGLSALVLAYNRYLSASPSYLCLALVVEVDWGPNCGAKHPPSSSLILLHPGVPKRGYRTGLVLNTWALPFSLQLEAVYRAAQRLRTVRLVFI